MTIDFKDLGLIKEIHAEIQLMKKTFENRVEKRWLSVKELAEYLDYSTDRIHKLKGEEFFEGFHYHKRSGKLLFDKQKVDDWVIGIDSYNPNANVNVENTVNNILDDLLDSTKKDTKISPLEVL